jgi:hypothetical protein
LTLPDSGTFRAVNYVLVDLTIPNEAILFYLANLDMPEWWNW